VVLFKLWVGVCGVDLHFFEGRVDLQIRKKKGAKMGRIELV
jgi:hypothetical protein